jgi:NmrA-like family protein
MVSRWMSLLGSHSRSNNKANFLPHNQPAMAAFMRFVSPFIFCIRSLGLRPRDSPLQRFRSSWGAMDNVESLKAAMKAVYGVYSVQDFWTVGARSEVQQGKNMADAARAAGIGHFLYSSDVGAERNSGISHWETKWEVENHIRKLGRPATMLRPAAFMENYYIDAGRTSVSASRVMW